MEDLRIFYLFTQTGSIKIEIKTYIKPKLILSTFNAELTGVRKMYKINSKPSVTDLPRAKLNDLNM